MLALALEIVRLLRDGPFMQFQWQISTLAKLVDGTWYVTDLGTQGVTAGVATNRAWPATAQDWADNYKAML